MSGLREEIVKALESDKWMARHLGIVAHAGDVADTVLRVLAEHGDTQQVRYEIRDVIEQTTGEPIFPPTMDAVMAVLAPIVAARDAAVERAERAEAAFDRYQQAKQPLAGAFAAACKEIADTEADLAAARQQLDQVRRAYHAWNEDGLGTVPGLRATNWPDVWRDIGYELDAPARPAGHDETGQS
jgi:hypothetical protein